MNKTTIDIELAPYSKYISPARRLGQARRLKKAALQLQRKQARLDKQVEREAYEWSSLEG